MLDRHCKLHSHPRYRFGIEFAPEVVQADGNVRNLSWRIRNARKVLVCDFWPLLYMYSANKRLRNLTCRYPVVKVRPQSQIIRLADFSISNLLESGVITGHR